MKRKTTIALLFLFFFTFIWQSEVNAKSINNYEEILAPPSNDDCANAITLIVNPNYLCSTVTSATLAEATASTGAPAGCNAATRANDDVWFKFVATSTKHRIQLSNIASTPTDLYMMVFDAGASGGDCSTLSSTIVACSDPDTADLTGLSIGNTYYIRVYSNSTASGATTTFDICVGTEPSAPADDECSTATALTSFPFNGTVDASSATNNTGSITGTGCIDMNDGVWYTIIGDGNKFTITVSPSSWDAAIAVYTGSCGTFTCVDDSNIGLSGVTEMASFNSVSGTTYYVNIAHPGSSDVSEGIFTMSVTSAVLSIDDIIAKGFSYYPNPVNGVLKMSASEPINKISLYSILGREILTKTDSDLNTEVDFSNLPSGAYYIRATVGDKSGTFKVIKN